VPQAGAGYAGPTPVGLPSRPLASRRTPHDLCRHPCHHPTGSVTHLLSREEAREAFDDPAGKPFPHLKYCVRCRIPQTQEGVIFDELGVCQACQSAEQKIHIGWTARE
jgi:hypothetical protein